MGGKLQLFDNLELKPEQEIKATGTELKDMLNWLKV